MILRAFLSRLIRAFLVGYVLLGATAAKAEAEYTFTLIADSTGPFSDFGVVPSAAINALGTVAFVARLDAGGAGVFKGNGGAITTITTAATPPFGNPFNPPSINEAGTVAFGGGDGVFAGNGGPLVTIADTAGQFRNFFAGYTASINAAGTVAFTASLDVGGGGIFAWSGGATAPVLVNSPTFSPDSGVSLNDAGTVAFRGYLGPSFTSTGIFTRQNGTIATVADSSGPFNYFGIAPSINAVGTVAFNAGANGRDGGVFGIYKGSGGPLTTIADLSGSFSYLGDFDWVQPSINASGMVAFSAALDAGGGGVFIGDGTITSKVIQVGDTLFGSTVTGAGVYPRSLNDSGQVAFAYGLANGTTGIAIANPVPEPSPSLLVALSLGLSLARRTRKC